MNNYNEKVKVCVVTVTYGDRFHLLKKVIEFCFNEGVKKVIVVDNASVENSKRQLEIFKKKYQNKLVVIHLNENIGSAGGYKKGLEEAYKCSDCDFIWLLDDDNKPEKGTLKKYLDVYFQLRLKNISLGALVGFRNSRPQYVEAVKKCDGAHLLEPLNSFIGFHVFHYWKKLWDKFSFLRFHNMKNCKLIKVPTAPYGGLFFEKDLLKRIGFPNKDYYLYEDDTEFTYRITKAGYGIYLVPEINIIDLDEYWCKKEGKKHPYFSTSEFRFYYFIRNKIFFQKNYRVTSKKVFNINKFIYFIRMAILSFIHRNIKRFHLFRRAVDDALKNNMGKRRFRILFISHVLDGSGAPRSLLTLIKHLPKKDNLDLRLLALRRDNLEKEFKEVLNENPIIITRKPPSNKFLKLIERILAIPKIIYYLWKINPDLVFINSAANSRAILISKLLGYKTYVFVHEFEEMFVSLASFRKKFIKLADKVFVTNEIQKLWVKENIKYKGEIKIIPNGIDLQEIEELLMEEPSEDFLKFTSKFNFLIANVGYMSLRKGWNYFLEIIKFLKNHKDIGFVIIGDFLNPSERGIFLKELEKENLIDRVFITGFVDNVFKYLKYCDIVAITSRSETFSRVALESIALGVPFIFFDVGAIKLVPPKDYKYKVEPFNLNKFVDYILEIKHLTDAEYEKLKKSITRRVDIFNIKSISEKFYHEITKHSK